MIKKTITILVAMALCFCAVDAAAAKKKSKKKTAKTTAVAKAPAATGHLKPHEPFVVHERPEPIKRGLDGKIIALWQSHGLYYDQPAQRWMWQRPRLFGTVEDLLTQGFVMPYLMPMLENAGAYVMSPRERDLSTVEVIVDTDGMVEGDFFLTEGRHKWRESEIGYGYAWPEGSISEFDNPFHDGTSETVATVGLHDTDGQSTANWSAELPARGRYAIYVSYASHPNSATDALYTISHLGGTSQVRVNQRMGGGTWIYLGHYDLPKGKQSRPIVTLTNRSACEKAVVSADAVKIGGGMGTVARAPEGELFDPNITPVTSGAPRFAEGARYWLQWAGMPPKVWTESGGTNDYTDDYKSRALWVNYLAGGSCMLPDSVGLGVPIDLAFAFHTDAGTTDDGSVIGTLGIYSTDGGNRLGNNRSRLECRDLATSVINQVTSDIEALHNPTWVRRGLRDGRYYEIRETKVPAMIMETLSHQNFDDMKFALDPQFRFDVSRAVYKGILRFIANRYGEKYVVQPLPPRDFSITMVGKNRYHLSWRHTPDPLEKSATPTYYLVEERIDGGAFRLVTTVTDPQYYAEIEADGHIHSYRITPGNDGGTGFASEVLAVYNSGGSRPDVNIINGFTRISAPADFCAGDFAGFDYQGDGGVADGADIITTGRQTDFTRLSEFINNDRPGFGASRGNLEMKVTAGNTRDFVYIHGLAVKAAGKGFVSASASAFALQDAQGRYQPPVIDLILGKQREIMPGNGSKGTRYKAFPPQLQQALLAHGRRGGAIMISGAFIGTDLMNNPYSDAATRSADATFASLMGFGFVQGCGSIDGLVREVPSAANVFGTRRYSFNVTPSAECYAVESPDALRPSGASSWVIMRYAETSLAAAIASEIAADENIPARPYRVIAMGFPFETIDGADQRTRLMRQCLNWLHR